MGEYSPAVIARQIVRAREYKGWNQVDLSNATGIAQGTISRYESGERRGVRPENLMKIADATGVTVDFLLGRYDGQDISQRIARARQLKSMSQQDLATALGIPISKVRAYESHSDGKYIPIEMISEIARVTGVSVAFLLGKDS